MDVFFQAVGRLAFAIFAIWLSDRQARQMADGTYRPPSRRRVVSWAIVLGVVAVLVWWSRTHP